METSAKLDEVLEVLTDLRSRICMLEAVVLAKRDKYTPVYENPFFVSGRGEGAMPTNPYAPGVVYGNAAGGMVSK